MPLSLKNAAIACALAFAAIGADARTGRRADARLASRFGRFNEVRGEVEDHGENAFRERGRGGRGSRGGKEGKDKGGNQERGGNGSKGSRGGKEGKKDEGGNRGKDGKKGKGSNKGKGGKDVLALEKIEACREEITLTCGMDLSFDLDTLTDRLEEIAAAKEEIRAAKREEAENRHAAVVDACPALVDYCGLPLELPAGPAEEDGKPSKEDWKAKEELRKAMECVVRNKGGVEVSQACEDVLAELKAEKAERGDRGDRREGRHEELGVTDDLKAMLSEVRDCIHEEIKPALDPLDEDSACVAAFTRPDKQRGSGEEPELEAVEVDVDDFK